jgi:hypothetical protein
MQEAGGTTEDQFHGLFSCLLSPSDVRAVTHFTRPPYIRSQSVLAFQRLQRADRICQATVICLLGNHGLDSHELAVIAPRPD